MDRAKQLLLTMLCGFPASHDLVVHAVADQRASEQLRSGGVTLQKDDLFSPLSTGMTIFEYREAWRHFDKIVGAVLNAGGSVSFDDFRKQAAPNKTLVDIALGFGYTEKLFSPLLWAGKSERDMATAWFRIDAGDRNRCSKDFLMLRRDAARAQGREVREDQLAKASVTPDDIRAAIRKGRCDQLNQKLAAEGDYLRKDDLFLFDRTGDHMLDSNEAWERFGALHEQLEAHGERLGVEDFLFKLDNRKSMLDYAEDHNQLDKIFNSKVWRGRSGDMLRLYKHVPQTFRKDALKIASLFDKLVTEEYGALKIGSGSLIKEALLTPLNDKDRIAAGTDFRPVIFLGLESTWNNIDEIRKELTASGERLALADLRRTSGYNAESCLRIAARTRNFAKVMDILKESGERLSLEDLKAEGKDGKSLLSVLADNHGIAAIMQPELWVSRGSEFLEVWKAIPSWDKRDIDIHALQSRINQLSLRERFAKKPFPPAP